MAENLHSGHRKRMRDKFINEGPGVFFDHELLEILLFYSITMRDTNPMAHKLLNEFGSLSMLFSANPKDVIRKSGVSENTAVLISIMSEFIKRCNNERRLIKKCIDSTKLAGEYAISILGYEKYECFCIINLDSDKKLINSSIICRGTIDEAHVYPRLVVEEAIRNKASSIILVHNHPSGNLKPSFSDIEITNKIVKAMNPIGIEVVDHIIVGNEDFFSFYKSGMIQNN